MEMTIAEAKAIIAKQQKELEELAAKKGNTVTISHSDIGNGAVMITGFGQHPFSAHGPQWKRMLQEKLVEKCVEYAISHADELRAHSYAKYYVEVEKKTTYPTGKGKASPEAAEYVRVYRVGLALAKVDATLKGPKFEAVTA